MDIIKRFSFIFIILTFVFSLGAADVSDQKGRSSEEVDAIYNMIRHRGAVYEWEGQEVAFTFKGMNMVGDLYVPKTNKKMPIVIFLNGFAGDRKELLVTDSTEYIWERVARKLAEQGLACLRVDFRGSGDSDGDFTMASFTTQIEDAIAMLDFITWQLRKRVDWKNIGIIGFSQGGLVGACTAARDDRVDSLCLWSPVSHPPIVYENLISKQGVLQGLALPEGGSDVFPIYVNETYVNWDVPLGKQFFDNLFQVAPLPEIQKNYTGPLFALCGVQDPIIWPQPHMSELYLRYHDGFEKLVMLDADHAFNWWDGPNPETFDDAIYWSAAWFLHTLE
jgi:pimeloyl-ACP methyl ester carboxylesterase